MAQEEDWFAHVPSCPARHLHRQPGGLHEAWAKRAEIMAGDGVDARNARALAKGGPEPQIVDPNALQDVMNEAPGRAAGRGVTRMAATEVAEGLEYLID